MVGAICLVDYLVCVFHVGLATIGRKVRLSEEFISKYFEVEDVQASFISMPLYILGTCFAFKVCQIVKFFLRSSVSCCFILSDLYCFFLFFGWTFVELLVVFIVLKYFVYVFLIKLSIKTVAPPLPACLIIYNTFITC